MRSWQLIRQSLENMRRSRLRPADRFGRDHRQRVHRLHGGVCAGHARASGDSHPQTGSAEQYRSPSRSGEQRTSGGHECAGSRASPPLDDAALRQLEAIDGVDYACPDFRLAEVEVTHGTASQRLRAVGLPREMSLISFLDELFQAGGFFTLSDQPEVILSDKTARQLGFTTAEQAVGQTVQIVAAGLTAKSEDEFAFRQTHIEARVTGVIRTPGFTPVLGDNALLLPVDVMRNLPGILAEPQLQRLRAQQAGTPGSYSRVTVRAARAEQVPRIEQEIRQLGFETQAMVTQIKEMRTFFIFLKLLLASVGTVALVVAGLGILNTHLITVMERKSEIGLYKAIGASDQDIRLMFLTEAAVVGLLGGLGGLLLARVVAALIQWVANVYLARQEIEIPMLLFRFPLWLLSAAVAYSVVASVISGLYPAGRAARLDPIQALRG